MNNKEAKKILDKTPAIVRFQYAGVIGLLCAMSVGAEEEDREMIEVAVADWCKLTGFTWKRILNRIEVNPPTE